MVKLNIDSNNLLISGFEQLEGQHLANIQFWKFKKNQEGNAYVLHLDIAKNILWELIDYLNAEDIQYSVCETTKHLLDDLNELSTEFILLKKKAKQYKEGNFKEIDLTEINSFLKNKVRRPLKDHQIEAAIHFYLLGNAANFSVPGSGKTAVVLSVYEKLRSEGKVNTLFIVGPLSCFSSWRIEFETVLGRKPDFKILAGGDYEKRKMNYYSDYLTKSEIYFTSFQTLLSDKENVKVLFDSEGINILLIVDEAHYIKKINGEWANAVLEISQLAKYRTVLTGTPLPRSYTDVYNLFDFLWPDKNPILPEKKLKIKRYEDKGMVLEAKQELQSEIGPLFYRVRKNDLNLSDQNFVPSYKIRMNENERKIYNAIYTRIKDYSKEEYFSNIDLVAMLCRGRIVRLRQCVSYCRLLKNVLTDNDEVLINNEIGQLIENYDILEVPAKIEYLMKLVKDLRNNKVIIWSNFIGTIDFIEMHLKSNGFNCKKIYGATPVERELIRDVDTREQIRDEFLDINSGLDILIANPAACSESISLHKTCHNSIYYDLSYNCAQYMQSLDRIHRVGGSEETISSYHFLEYIDTIDRDIRMNLEQKKDKMTTLIDEECNIYSLDMFEDDGDLEAYNRLFKGNK